MSGPTVPHHRSRAKSPVSVAHPRVQHRRRRKAQLVQLGVWGMNVGKGWVVRGVQRALQQEGLAHE
jgi:hypothetical protein